MKLFWTLTRAQLRGLLSSVGNSNTRKTRPRSAWLMLGLLALLALYLSGTYSFALASVLGGTGNLDLVLELMPFVGAGFTVLLGAQSAGTFVFAGRDNDLLLALPIPRLTLALAKLAAVLLENLLFMLCMVLPAGLAYALATPTPAWLWPAEVLGAALLALVTTALSVALGLVITVVNNLRQGTTIVNVLGMLLLLGFVAGSLVGQVPLMKSLEADPAPVRAWIGTWTPPLTWVRDVAVDGSLPALALLVLATVVPFAGVAWLVGRSFVALVGQATAKRGGVRKVAVSSMKARTPFVALVRRESQRFFGSSIYFLNTGFGLAMLLLGAGYLIVIRELPAGFAEVARVIHVSPAILVALAACGVASTIDTTAPSISLEGQRLWILKEAPLPTRTVLAAKVAFNVAITAPVLLVVAVVGAIVTHAAPADAALLFVLPLAFMLVIAQLGLITNLTWPNLNAPNDTIAVKQGASVLAAIFGGMGLAALTAIGGFALAPILGGSGAFWVITLGLAALAAGEQALIRTWGVGAFAAL